jgi:toxin ParE1/3/4
VDYLARLDNAFFKIAENPGMGRSAEHILSGYCSYSGGKHIIFYQERSDIILIVRILHQNMDMHRNLN